MSSSYTCPRCGMTSHHPLDIKYRYCGNCHQFENVIETPEKKAADAEAKPDFISPDERK